MTALVTTVVGARPQFIKLAPFCRHLAGMPCAPFAHRIVHTGQHYDDALSGTFFRELGIPAPDADLGVGSGSHGAQTGAIMVGLEADIAKARPDLIVVYGDTNSTLAAALVAAKAAIPLAHVEAGLRSFRLDRFDGVFVLDDEVVRPPDFDLAEAWAQINVGFVEHALTVSASGRVASGGAVAALRARLGARVTLGATGKDGWIEFEARGWSHEVLGRELAGFGADLDVSAPAEVREVLARLGLELVELYG